MLYKNDVVYDLNRFEKEVKELKEHFHNKFPLRVIYPPERVVPSRNKHNRLPDKPNSISFDLKALVKTPNGTELWRYAEDVLIDDKGNKKFLPKKFIFNGIRILDEKEIELIYFLYKKSPYCKGGENEGPITKFMFEDLVTDAEKKVARKQIQTKIDMLLYNEELGLKEDRLREVARAFFIKGINNMSVPQVKIALENFISSTKDGPKKFFDMINADTVIKSRASITKVIEDGKIVLQADGKSSVWMWKTAQGMTQICRVPVDKAPDEALWDYYLGDKNFQEDVQAVLIAGDPKAGKSKKKEDVPVE